MKTTIALFFLLVSVLPWSVGAQQSDDMGENTVVPCPGGADNSRTADTREVREGETEQSGQGGTTVR